MKEEYIEKKEREKEREHCCPLKDIREKKRKREITYWHHKV
jgi:hypothetical protein